MLFCFHTEKGYWPGNCLNEWRECNEYANCKDSPDGLGYSCICPEGSVGDGHTKGSGCDLRKPIFHIFNTKYHVGVLFL